MDDAEAPRVITRRRVEFVVVGARLGRVYDFSGYPDGPPDTADEARKAAQAYTYDSVHKSGGPYKAYRKETTIVSTEL